MGLEEMVRMLRNQLSARQEEVDGSNVLPTPTVIKVKSINPSVVLYFCISVYEHTVRPSGCVTNYTGAARVGP